jgi:hypothetical protein
MPDCVDCVIIVAAGSPSGSWTQDNLFLNTEDRRQLRRKKPAHTTESDARLLGHFRTDGSLAPTEIDTGTPTVDTPVDDIPGATPDAGNGAGPTDTADEAQDPVGTRPGFVDSPYNALHLPLDQLHSVLPADAIPAITDPEMVRGDQVDFLSESDPVFGVVINGEARAYPHNIGWWHEIVNDRVGGHPVSVTFCPLTGTGLFFDGETASGGRLELGVSGLLYNSNLVMFDRDDQSLYPQIYAASVSDVARGQTLTLMPVVETTWSAWKRLYPNTLVIANGPYGQSHYWQYPYGDYRTDNNDFLFSIRPSLSWNRNGFSTRIPSKDRVLGLRIDADTRAYPYAQMGNQTVVNDILGGHEIAVVYDAKSRLAIPYSRRVEDGGLTFEIVLDGFPFSLRDIETETLWDIKGQAVDGPLKGQQLTQLAAHSSMWFAWVTFWPNTDVWNPKAGPRRIG